MTQPSPIHKLGFAELLRKARESKRLTLMELSKISHCAVPTIIQCEHEDTIPRKFRSDVVVRLALALELDPKELLLLAGCSASNVQEKIQKTIKRVRSVHTNDISEIESPTPWLKTLLHKSSENTLLCWCFTSPLVLGEKESAILLECLKKGLGLAFVCPYPLSSSRLLRAPYLSSFFSSTYSRLYCFVNHLNDATHKHANVSESIKIFQPKSDESLAYPWDFGFGQHLHPLLFCAENPQSSFSPKVEYAVYSDSMVNAPMVQSFKSVGGSCDRSEVIDAVNCWCDYFRTIIAGWYEGKWKNGSVQLLQDWRLV